MECRVRRARHPARVPRDPETQPPASALLVLDAFGEVIARGGSGVLIASQSGHRLPPLTVEENKALATTPVEDLLSQPFLQLDQVRDSLHAYQLAPR